MVVDRYELTEKLQKLKGIVPRNTVLEPTRGVLVKNGKVHANNLTLAMTTRLSVISDEMFVIPAKAVDMMATLPKGELSITSNENHKITVKIGSIKHSFLGIDPTDFPEKTTEIEGEGITINGKELKKALKFVLPAVGTDSNRPAHCGVRFESSGGCLDVVSVDGYRMHWVTLDYEGDISVTVPSEAVNLLMKLDLNDDVNIKVDERQMVVNAGDYIITASLYDGQFLSYSSIYSNSGKHSFKVSRLALEKAVTRAHRCMEDKMKSPLEVTFKGDTVNIAMYSSLGEYEENIQAESVHGSEEELRIGFNVRYLLDAIKSHSGEEVTWNIGSNTEPTTIENSEDCNYCTMVLPVRLRDRGVS